MAGTDGAEADYNTSPVSALTLTEVRTRVDAHRSEACDWPSGRGLTASLRGKVGRKMLFRDYKLLRCSVLGNRILAQEEGIRACGVS